MRQKPVLLSLVETVNLVDEQQRAATVAATDLGRFEDLLQIRNAREDRADLHEGEVSDVGQKPCNCGLANSRRSPQDQGAQGVGTEHRAKRTVRAEQFVLANHLLQRARAQAVRQRMPGGLGLWSRTLEQICHLPCRLRSGRADEKSGVGFNPGATGAGP